MVGDECREVSIRDAWETLPDEFRADYVARRVKLPGTVYGRTPDYLGRWEPLRPVVVEAPAYRALESVLARLLQLAVAACRRRAATVGELHQVLRFPYDMSFVDPDRPLPAAGLIRHARPDILIEQGRPRILEFNLGGQLGGDAEIPALTADFAGSGRQGILRPPLSTRAARAEALLRTVGDHVEARDVRRLLVPTRTTKNGRRLQRGERADIAALDAQRVGFEVVRADLADLRLDEAGRLVAAGVPIDVVSLLWSRWHAIGDADGGLAALRAADRAGTVGLFPRPESVLLSSKAVLAWLHEDSAAGVLDEADCGLIRGYLPPTVCLGLNPDPAAPENPAGIPIDERAGLVVKPAYGRSGMGVIFGSDTSRREWHRATVEAARRAPVVVQQRVEPDSITMPFIDRQSGQRVSARVRTTFSPFLIDGAAASVLVRLTDPEAPDRNAVISGSRGAIPDTALLVEPAAQQVPGNARRAGLLTRAGVAARRWK